MSEIKMHRQESVIMFVVWVILTAATTIDGQCVLGVIDSILGMYIAYSRHRQWSLLVKEENE